MKITICGSIAFYDEMLMAQQELELSGHEVNLPPSSVPDDTGRMIPVQQYYQIRKSAGDDEAWVWEKTADSMRNHFDKVAWADAIIVLNYSKNNITNYIGANTLLEMGLAFYLKKRIYLLNSVPDISYKEEILGMRPTILNGNLSSLKELVHD